MIFMSSCTRPAGASNAARSVAVAGSSPGGCRDATSPVNRTRPSTVVAVSVIVRTPPVSPLRIDGSHVTSIRAVPSAPRVTPTHASMIGLRWSIRPDANGGGAAIVRRGSTGSGVQ